MSGKGLSEGRCSFAYEDGGYVGNVNTGSPAHLTPSECLTHRKRVKVKRVWVKADGVFFYVVTYFCPFTGQQAFEAAR